ncbi:type VI secretion system tip protein TssI/VgrG [Pseudomonas sp. RC10]|uniref:type VI secretion system Vgr family protein n=1 Tax=Pseudomonas bambusae TaxID=3139142 RepID=UPI003138BB4C
MHKDSPVTMTLSIASRPSDLLVVGVKGRDRLNAPFCFDIDLVSPDPALDLASLRQCNAGLEIGGTPAPVHGVHGQISDARQLYRGADLSVYRLRLTPALQQLCGPTRRRAFNGLTVPQILTRLLHDHGLTDGAFRFDHLIGVYPRRPHCLQYDESDLHFLQRLCEEEGIAFRHEHALQRHTLVFSDDPMGFPEGSAPAPIDHLAEQLSVQASYSSHAGEHYTPQAFAPQHHASDADNQRLCAVQNANRPLAQQQQKQISVRLLERLRCERREIRGRSRLPWFRAGLVVRVDGQPDPLLNDQSLLTDVRHSAWQLAPLRGCTSNDVIHILQAMASEGAADMGIAQWLLVPPGADRPALAGYENSFSVLPWTMPFRPSLEHPQPVVASLETATLIDGRADEAGRVRIRYGWQTEGPASPFRDSWARVVGSLTEPRAGMALRIQFFEGDPDQPLVCGMAEGPERISVLEPTERDGASPPTKPPEPAPVLVDSKVPLTLRGARATLHINAHGIRYTPHATGDDGM